jgi:3-hydroxyisobutyrate dehydrogenase
MGTMSQDHIADLVKAAPRGVFVIDAPVSGATQAAADAQLLIMAGCSQADGHMIAPLFNSMGRKTIYLGQAGAGAVMKLSVNSLLHAINQSFSEAMILAEAADIPTTLAYEAIEASAACAPMLKYRRNLYLDEAVNDVTFTIDLASKDMAATMALAVSLGLEMPQGEITTLQLRSAQTAGFGSRDMAAMLAFARKELR